MGITTINTDELDRMKRRLAAYERDDAKREERFKSLKTPEQLATMGKPFPMPGQVWRFDGTENAEPSGEHTIVGLRWFYGRAEAVFADDRGVAGINHMMELDAWVFVR